MNMELLFVCVPDRDKPWDHNSIIQRTSEYAGKYNKSLVQTYPLFIYDE